MEEADVGTPAVVGLVAGVACMGLFFWRARAARAHRKMEEAQRRGARAEEEAYVAAWGEVASSQAFQAQFSRLPCVASKTLLRHKWAERSVAIEPSDKPGGRERAVYGEWESKSELVGEPLTRAVPFAVVARDGAATMAVHVDAPVDSLPLLLRHSQSLDEQKKSSVNVINNVGNNGIAGQLSGGRELRELGTLREELVLPTGTMLCIFGRTRLRGDGAIEISGQGCGGDEPFVAVLHSPSTEIASRASLANRLQIAACIAGAVAVVSVGLALYRAAK